MIRIKTKCKKSQTPVTASQLLLATIFSALHYFMWVDVVKWLPNNPKSEEKGRGI